MSNGKHLKEIKKKKLKKSSLKWCVANIVVVVIFLTCITSSLIVLDRPTESYTEKRDLAAFPDFNFETLFNGKYTDDITNWYDDTVPWRDDIKKISSNLMKYMGIPLNGVTFYGKPSETISSYTTTDPSVSENSNSSDVITEEEENKFNSSTETSIPETTTYDPKNEIAPGVQTNGQLVYLRSDGHYWGSSLYGGGYAMDTFANVVNEFAERLDDVQVYVMLPTTSGEYYIPYEYDAYNASQYKDICYIADRLSDKVINIDCYNVLLEHTTEPIYLRTDHHWQPLGAYYAAEAFAKVANVPFADIHSYEKIDVEGYVGSIYTYTQDSNLLNDPETFTYYKPSNKYFCDYYDTSYNLEFEQWPLFIPMDVSNSYSTFFGGDAKIVRVETDVKNGRKLAVFKDSYGNAEIPFYTGSFEEIFVCDIRYFNLNAVEFLKEQGITDLLFSMCTFSAAGQNCDLFMENLLTQ